MTTGGDGIPDDLNVIEAALGRMVYRAGNLEAVVRSTGTCLAVTDSRRRLLDGVPAGKLVEETRKLAREAAAGGRISDAAASGLVKLLDEIGPHLKTRNVYIHGVWVSRADEQPFAMLSRKNLEVQSRPLVLEEIGRFSDILLARANDVFDWAERNIAPGPR